MNREMMARRLQRSGFSVATAENGRIALEKLKQGNFDLVLLDIIMPDSMGSIPSSLSRRIPRSATCQSSC